MTLTPTELAAHNENLGGSDALAYCGKDPRCTPLELYQRITDARDGKPVPERDIGERGDWGSRLEPVVRDWLGEKIGAPIMLPEAGTIVSKELPFMIGNLDGITPLGPAGVEIKTADKFMAQELGDTETDQVPVRWVLQVTHYMLVTGLRRFHIGALVGGNDARHYVVDFDPELAGQLLARARLFWSHVETRTPPDPVTLEDAALRWPRSNERIIKANDVIQHAVGELNKLRRQERDAKMQADSVELSLKAFMGESAILADDAGHKLATWRQQTRERLDAKALCADHPDLAAQYRTANTFRVFLLKQ